MATTVPKSLLDYYKDNMANVTQETLASPSSYALPAVTTPGTPTGPSNHQTGLNPVTPTTTSDPGVTTPPPTTTTPEPSNEGLLSSVALPESAKVSATGYTPTSAGDPTQWTVDSSQTTSGNLNRIIAEDSPLMQQARTAGLQQAAQRGLLNSSIAVGTAQDQVIKNATPIAQSDADVYARAAGYNADTSNTFKTNAANTQTAASQFGAEAQNRAGEFNATNEYGQYQNEFEKQQQLFQANVDASLEQIKQSANWDLQTQDIFGGLSKGFSDAMTAINTDHNMNQKSKDYAIAQLFEAYKAQISLLSAVGSVPDVSQLLTWET